MELSVNVYFINTALPCSVKNKPLIRCFQDLDILFEPVPNKRNSITSNF
ncbi:hypothetical protein LCGC14_0719630 [marine sediment metagenome]|uniref:Uncharacterized protein n=1 Tax=marine sediment metagenome TaxID=412755 RepID=A0A0F9SY64_9ZZZZ